MAEAQIVVQPPVVVEITAEGEAPVEVIASPAVRVELATEGVQGPAGVTVVEWAGSKW
jgi:hypothetical protein